MRLTGSAATWVLVVGLPVYMVSELASINIRPRVQRYPMVSPSTNACLSQVNTLAPVHHPRLGPLDYFAVALWAGSWAFELGK